MSPMAQMSKAIRTTIEQHAPTLPKLTDGTLMEFHSIVGAFYFELSDEMKKRGLGKETT
jgi:hypothetical protein